MIQHNDQYRDGESSINLDKNNKRSIQYLIKPSQKDLEQIDREYDRDITDYKTNLKQGSCFNLIEFKSENVLQKNTIKNESESDQSVSKNNIHKIEQKQQYDNQPQPYEVKVISPCNIYKNENINSPFLQPNLLSFTSMQNPQTISSMNNQEQEIPQLLIAKQESTVIEQKVGEPVFLQFFRKYKQRNLTQKVIKAIKDTNNQKYQEEKKVTELKKKTHNFWSKLKSYVYISSLLNMVQNENSKKEVQMEENYIKLINDMASASKQESIKEQQFIQFYNHPQDKDQNISFSALNRKRLKVLEPHELTSILIDLWMQVLIIIVLFQYSVELFFSFEHNQEFNKISKTISSSISMVKLLFAAKLIQMVIFISSLFDLQQTLIYFEKLAIQQNSQLTKKTSFKIFIFVSSFQKQTSLLLLFDFFKKFKINSYYQFYKQFSFAFDIIRNFNTGYFYKGIVIMERIKIAKMYTGKLLFFDIIALISQVIISLFGKHILEWHWTIFYAIKVLIFFRISSFLNSQRRLSNFFNTKPKLHEWISVFKLFAYLLLLAHIVAIMFHGLAQYEIVQLNYHNTWLHEANIEKEGWIIRYLNSIFWATGSMVTVILYNPKTLEETIFINVILLINCLVFGFTIKYNNYRFYQYLNQKIFFLKYTWRYLKKFKQRQKGFKLRNKYHQQVKLLLPIYFNQSNIFHRYLNLRQVSSNLKIKIRNYLEYMNKNVLTKNQEDENQVLNKLSNALQDELKREINFKRIKLFTPIIKNFSQPVLYNLLIKIQEINITPNEQIINFGILDDCSIYVVSSGEVQINLGREDEFDGNANGEGQIVKTLKKGDIFGEASFFTGEVRKASAISVDFGQLYKITRQDFIQLLKGRHLDEERFAFIKDSLLFYKQYDKIGLKCYVCQSQNHLSGECNKIHLGLVKRKVLNPVMKNSEQIRGREYKREDRKHRMSSINTLQLQKDCWIALELFIQHNYEEIDCYELEYQINDYSLTLDEDDELINPQQNFVNVNDQSEEEDSNLSPQHHQQKQIYKNNEREYGTQQLQPSPPFIHNKQQLEISSTNQIPVISQWLPNSMQQFPDGKNFHDYIEIFNKEMRMQQKGATNSNLRKQASMQMASILKEMNKQRQEGPQGQQKKPVIGSLGDQIHIQRKSFEKTGGFLSKEDQIQTKIEIGSKNEVTFPSQNDLTSNQLSDSDEDRKTIVDENTKTKNIKENQNMKEYCREKSDKNIENLDYQDEERLCSFREQQIDEQVFRQNGESKQLPLFKSHFNLYESNSKNNHINFQNQDKINSPKFQTFQKQPKQSYSQRKSYSHSTNKIQSPPKIIYSDEKKIKTQVSQMNKDAQVSIDCSTPSQGNSFSISSNLKGLSQKKLPGGSIDERRISNLSSINAKRVSRDSIFFKQHNISHILNSPYKHSPKNTQFLNQNVPQSPYLEQNQLSAIIEDFDLLDEKITSQKQHPSQYFTFIKRPTNNFLKYPQFFQENSGISQNTFQNINYHIQAPNLLRNYPSFSSNLISQGHIYNNLDANISPSSKALTPKRDGDLSGSRMQRQVAAENRRKSMFATFYNSPEQQNRYIQQVLKNNYPSNINNLHNDSTTQQPQINTNSSTVNNSQQISKKRKQLIRLQNDSQIIQQNNHAKRQSILRNPLKLSNLGQPQQQLFPQSNLNMNGNSFIQQPPMMPHLNTGLTYTPNNNSEHYRASQIGQQLNFQTIKLDQYMESNQYPFIFDGMKLFKIYFILGNYDVVIERLQQRRKKSFKKQQGAGQIRRLITRNQKDKAFTQFQSLKMHKNMLTFTNPPQFLQNTENFKNNIFASQNQRKETVSSNKLSDIPLGIKKIQSEVMQ